MKLLGSYPNSLTLLNYTELVKLLETAVEQGEYSGNKTFDSDALDRIRAAAQDFANLAMPSAGQRITDDALNSPLQTLLARFNAVLQESSNFDTRCQSLISALKKDTGLLDQLIFGAALEHWMEQQPRLLGSSRYGWDFGMGYGSVSSKVPTVDPWNSVTYTSRPRIETLFDGSLKTALRPEVDFTSVGIKSLTWVSDDTLEEATGDDWATAELLADSPRVTFLSQPQVTIQAGGSIDAYFSIGGSANGNFPPVYVRIGQTPRRDTLLWTVRNWVDIDPNASVPCSAGQQVYVDCMQYGTGANGTVSLKLIFFDAYGNAVLDNNGQQIQVTLPGTTPAAASQLFGGLITVPNSPIIVSAKLVAVTTNTTGTIFVTSKRVHPPVFLGGKVDPGDVQVFAADGTAYLLDTDYVVSSDGHITFRDLPDNQDATVRFTEYYPSYQCSINEKDWSPVVMLDPIRPFPDDETNYRPLGITGNAFPVTDELGRPTGMTLTMRQRTPQEHVFLLATAGRGLRPGVTANLEIELDKLSFVHSLALEPCTSFPMTLLSVEVDGLTQLPQVVISDEVQIDRPMTLSFPPILTRKIRLKLAQENYTWKEHEVEPEDLLRREAMNLIQGALPYQVQRPPRVSNRRDRGAQYEFGLTSLIAGRGIEQTGVFIAGPFRFQGSPSLVRLVTDAQAAIYLCYSATNTSRVTEDENLTGVAMTDGQAKVFPFASGANRANIIYTDMYLKIVLRDPADHVERFLLEVTNAV